MPFDLPFIRRPGDLILGRTGPAFVFPSYRLRAEQRTTHMYVLGITGQGKSKLLQNCLFQDIIAGRGCGILDPHSDLVRDLLAQLGASGYLTNPAHQDRVVFFDPARTDYIMPFNVLASKDPPYTTAINVIEAFRRTWPESLREAPRFTNILLASLLVLIANHRTLVDTSQFLTDKKFRNGLLENVDDPQIVSVFHDRLDRFGREEPLILESILNKVSAFALNPMLRAILGHPENKLDMRTIMDEGKVLIVDLGRCDGETRRLLGSLIVTAVEQAAISRKDELGRNRRPFYFYIDEFQDFCANEASTTSLAHILSESRKFGLDLTLAHQTRGQMSSERLQSALGNIGTKVVFAVDRTDAEVMARKLFFVDPESIKHEVEDTSQKDKSHPVYYSLPEGWEYAVQAIQDLRPRTFFVKTPSRGVVKLHAFKVPERRMSAQRLESLLEMLVRQKGSPYPQAPAKEDTAALKNPVEPLGFYEPAKPSSEPLRRRLSITSWPRAEFSGTTEVGRPHQTLRPRKASRVKEDRRKRKANSRL